MKIDVEGCDYLVSQITNDAVTTITRVLASSAGGVFFNVISKSRSSFSFGSRFDGIKTKFVSVSMIYLFYLLVYFKGLYQQSSGIIFLSKFRGDAGGFG